MRRPDLAQAEQVLAGPVGLPAVVQVEPEPAGLLEALQVLQEQLALPVLAPDQAPLGVVLE